MDDLVEAYRLHNEPLHETLEAFDGVLDLLPVLGRRAQLGIVTASGTTIGSPSTAFPSSAS